MSYVLVYRETFTMVVYEDEVIKDIKPHVGRHMAVYLTPGDESSMVNAKMVSVNGNEVTFQKYEWTDWLPEGAMVKRPCDIDREPCLSDEAYARILEKLSAEPEALD